MATFDPSALRHLDVGDVGPTARGIGGDLAERLLLHRIAVWSTLRAGLFVTAGALPVLAISAHVFGLVPIDVAARYAVVPAALSALLLALRPSFEARLFRRGLLAGLVAVSLYDAVRLPFVLTGIWPDFIPRVGGWVVSSDEPNAVLGYTWRYVGNGGGMAVFFVFACAVLGVRRHLVRLGVAYGVFVWSGLIATVTLAERGQALLFEISPLSITVSLVGHLVYGSVLGFVYTRMLSGDPSLGQLPAADLLGRHARSVVERCIPARVRG
jgi:hypothetical protein